MVTNNDIGYNPSSFESTLPEIHEMTTLAFDQKIRWHWEQNKLALLIYTVYLFKDTNVTNKNY